MPFIWLIDIVNKLASPFEPFTRPPNVKYYETLEEKKDKFEDHLHKFWQGDLLNYRLPIGDAGDQCLHHGLYTAMLVLKRLVTKDDALIQKAINGLALHQLRILDNVHLIRGIQADGTITENVSNDQLSGHLLGCYYVWRYIDSLQGAILLEGIADELLKHNHSLVNIDGNVTLYGKLINGYLTDPLNLTLCLATYRLAYLASGKNIYQKAYSLLFKTYNYRIPYAHFRFLWLGQSSTALRAAIHYHILLSIDTKPEYKAGMHRLVNMEKNTGSPVLTFLTHGYGMDLAIAKKHLLEYTLEDKQLSVTKINSNYEDTVKWGSFRRVKQPLPRYKVRSEDFFDARHWYSCDDTGTGEEHNGGDFLFGYYGLKWLGLL